MAEIRYSLVAYLEILTPAGEPDGVAWAALSRIIHREIAAPDNFSGFERSSLQLGNQLVLVQPLEIQRNLQSPIGLPFHLLLGLAYLQVMLCLHGTFLRGVVAHGEVRVRGEAIVGPGVRAAQLQARQEHLPRIIVDPGLLQAIAQDPLLRAHDSQEELGYIKRLLAQDTDGLWFVDYVAAMEKEVNEPEVYREWLDAHARQIEDALARVHARNDDARGWLWLATQHDRVVDKLEGIAEASRASLRVASDTPLRFRF